MMQIKLERKIALLLCIAYAPTMKRKFKAGDKIAISDWTLRITRANEDDAFGNTPHYGFYWTEQDSIRSGWMPVEIMEAIGRLVE